MLGAGLDAGGDGLEIEEGAAATGAGDVIRLEAATAGGLQDIIGEAERQSGAAFAADEDGVAYTVGQERADDDASLEQGYIGQQGDGFEIDAILEQDWIIASEPLEFGGEQAE